MMALNPMGWTEVKIRDLLYYIDERVELEDETEYITITVKRRHGGLEPRETLYGHQIKTQKQFKLHPGFFIMSRVQCWHQAYAIVPEDIPLNMIASSNYDQYQISNLVDPRFFWWLSHTPEFTQTVRDSAVGVVIEKMVFKRDDWLQKTLLIPPLDEQRRIVAHIEALAAKIEEARGLRRGALEEAERIQKSAISDVFDRTIQASKWQLRPITEAAQIARGKFSFRPRNDPRFYGGDIPFIQIGDISNSTKYIKEYSQTLNEAGLDISRLFPIGTVLIAITGATIGATGILTFPSCFPDSIVGFIAIDGLTTSEFIYWSLEYAKQAALDEAKTTTQPNINLEKLRRILIPIPSLDEQAHISEYLNNLQLNIEALHSLQVGVVEELDALLPSILDKAFKGEL